MVIKNYVAKGSIQLVNEEPTGIDVAVLTGKLNGTVIKTLEINAGDEGSIVNIIRKDQDNATYSTIKVDIPPYNYVLLWEGFIVIPYNHKLILNADSEKLECIANVIEL